MAAIETEVRFNMQDLAKDITLNVRITGERSFRIRSWIAIKLIQMAAMVFPANVNVHLDET
jgi:hypothetical protein